MATSKKYPAVGRVFELTLDGDASKNDPLEMVRRDGHRSPEKWEFKGKKVMGIQTRNFRLVRVANDYPYYHIAVYHLTDKVCEEIMAGEVEGQWREAFKAAYPNHSGKGPVGVPDFSWVSPIRKEPYFPCIDKDGKSRFYWAGSTFIKSWRWLVPTDKPAGK